MTDLLIRDVPENSVLALKEEASARGTSLQKLLQEMVEQSAFQNRRQKALAMMKESQKLHKNNGLPLAEDLIHQMRDERLQERSIDVSMDR